MLFGGSNPTRTLLPVPTSVVLNDYYTKIETNDLLDDKANSIDLTNHISNTSNPHNTTKTQV
jgi:hypothetical protein